MSSQSRFFSLATMIQAHGEECADISSMVARSNGKGNKPGESAYFIGVSFLNVLYTSVRAR